MRILKLTKDSKQNILENLLKRSPNNYTEYESSVNEIINNVRDLTRLILTLQISVLQKKKYRRPMIKLMKSFLL